MSHDHQTTRVDALEARVSGLEARADALELRVLGGEERHDKLELGVARAVSELAIADERLASNQAELGRAVRRLADNAMAGLKEANDRLGQLAYAVEGIALWSRRVVTPKTVASFSVGALALWVAERIYEAWSAHGYRLPPW